MSRAWSSLKNSGTICRDRMFSCITTWILLVSLTIVASIETEYSREKDPTYWYNVAHTELDDALREQPLGVAKNVILFLGDGMGPSTVTAARILHGQMYGKHGEEVMLSFDMFPYTGLSKTYNVNRQITDSAASGTAYLTGIKTNQGILGVNAKVVRATCSTVKGNEVDSILRWALNAGKSAGIVTTTRVTHATPAASYSHSPERNWESDSKIPSSEKDCKDIAAQLIDNNEDINVILGGGRAAFYPQNTADSHTEDVMCQGALCRKDGRNLISEWENKKKAANQKYQYVHDRSGLESVDAANTDYLLGLFAESHLEYEQLRNKSLEPSIAEMTSKAIQILKKNKNGFFLLVEGGRIDHGHHMSQPSLALHDTVAFAEAVERATQQTNKTDTLNVVTADHSHTMTIAGYADRGNHVLGLSTNYGEPRLANDNMPYTTLLYANGPGHTSPRVNLTDVDTEDALYRSQSALPLTSETHGGEDVAIYAQGPHSFLYTGVHEQNYIPIVMAYAACIGPYGEGTSKRCARDVQPPPTQQPSPGVCDSGPSYVISASLLAVCLSLHHFFKICIR